MTVRSWLHRARCAKPHVAAVAWRAVALVGALTLLYLGIANLVLKTRLLRDFVAAGDDVQVEYDSASSTWPGRVHVRNLSVRFQDHNVQILLRVERGTLDVSLLELFRKRFHALRVDAQNVSYRMRHKLHAVGKEGPRLAAYPPIPGFADPPLYTGEPPKPIPDDQYALWDVELENVTARVEEIWVLEYRYRGPGVARGAFHLRPARYYDVRKATLELGGGKLTLGSKAVAERAFLTLECSVGGSDPGQLTGREPLRAISFLADGTLEDADLAFLDAYLVPHVGLSATGRGNLDLRAELAHGVVGPGTRIAVLSTNASLGTDTLRVRGPSVFSLKGSKSGGPLELGFFADRVKLECPRAQGAAPSVDQVDVRVRATSDLSSPIRVVGAELKETHASIPDLGWLNRAIPLKNLPRLTGSATLALDARRDAEGRATAAARLELTELTLGVGDRSSLPLRAKLTTNLSAELDGPPRVEGTSTLHADRASALLPLLSDSAFLRQIEITLLKLDTLDAHAKFSVDRTARVDLLGARSGIARARGYLLAKANGAHGAFLVSTPAANLGIRVAPTATRVLLFVADDWLETGSGETARGVLARPERGRLSR